MKLPQDPPIPRRRPAPARRCVFGARESLRYGLCQSITTGPIRAGPAFGKNGNTEMRATAGDLVEHFVAWVVRRAPAVA